ncbi:hypothetical protein [Acaryochloris marina]|nr:hypothetical protein [Acaryochloris marina]
MQSQIQSLSLDQLEAPTVYT